MEQDEGTSTCHILLIGDNRFLLELVATNLLPWCAEAIMLDGVEGDAPALPYMLSRDGACRLVVLALSRSMNEPVIVLARTNLTHLVGAVPLLIISDRPFATDDRRRIFHLTFPFRAEVLQQIVSRLLQ